MYPKYVKIYLILFTISIFQSNLLFADEARKPAKVKAEIQALLKLVETKKSPNNYAAVYYPRFKKSLDGLKAVTVEAIAENAHEKMGQGVKLEIVGDAIIQDNTAGILLKRSGGKTKEGIFSAYLYYHADSNGWRFLGFPIPYKTSLLDALMDGRFMSRALNDPTPYDGVLYEFDKATKEKYQGITKKLNQELEKLSK